MDDVIKEVEYYNKLTVKFDDFINVPALNDGEIFLACASKKPADPIKKFVPAYQFAICREGEIIGEINLRIGYVPSLYYGGHIGYTIDQNFRGNGFAGRACKLVSEVAKAHAMTKLIITNVSGNTASFRVCEKLGLKFLRLAELPTWHNMYHEGSRFVNIFEWNLA